MDTDNDTHDFYVGKKTPGTHNQVKNPQGAIPEFHQLMVAGLILAVFVINSRRKRLSRLTIVRGGQAAVLLPFLHLLNGRFGTGRCNTYIGPEYPGEARERCK